MVTVPADFTLSESCMELMNQLAVTIYKCALLKLTVWADTVACKAPCWQCFYSVQRLVCHNNCK